MATTLKDRVAIVGIGKTAQGTIEGSTALGLGIEAFRNAIADAGLEKEQIDGILTHPGTTSPEGATHYLRFAQAVGLNPRYSHSLVMGGGSGGALIQSATMAIEHGLADYVACIFGDSARSGGVRFGGSMAGGNALSQGIWGMFGPHANSAMGARRHMALYGTTSEQLGHLAVNIRNNANLNPDAVMYDRKITVEDHQNSRWIVEPLHLLDCCLISDGGVCIILTSAERAKDLRQKPVYLSGMGQAYQAVSFENDEWWYLEHQKSALADAFAMAEVTPQEIDVAQLYDNFTISVLFWLEHAGFVGKGEAGPFVGEDRTALGAELPVNTAGGNLSESYMEGWLHIYEGAVQMRGDGGPRQVEGAKLCLTTGRGLNLNTSNALIMRNDD